MLYIANMRIKKGGKFYKAGDTVQLTQDDLKELPEGAATPKPEDQADAFVATSAKVADQSSDALQNTAQQVQDNHSRLKAAAAELPEAAFKNDGSIRADALKTLSADLGFDVTAADVAQARAAAS